VNRLFHFDSTIRIVIFVTTILDNTRLIEIVFMANRIDCNYEINTESITLDFKNGNFSRIYFDDFISVAIKRQSDLSFWDSAGPALGVSILCTAGTFIVKPHIRFFTFWIVNFFSIWIISTFLVLPINYLFRKQWDDIDIDTKVGKKIVFSVERGKTGEVVSLMIRKKAQLTSDTMNTTSKH
jgi:hypothetical protein